MNFDQQFNQAEQDRNASSPAREKPLFTLPLTSQDPDDEKKVLEWLKAERDWLIKRNEPRFRKIKRWLARYKGIQYHDQDVRGRESAEAKRRAKQQSPKIVIQNDYDISEQRTAKLLKFKPAVQVLPAQDEWKDRIGSIACKRLIDHIQYKEGYAEKIRPEFLTFVASMGEAYLFVEYDPDDGELDPDYAAAKSEAEAKGTPAEGEAGDGAAAGPVRVPVIGENGEQEKDEQGNPVYFEEAMHVGDVTYRVKMTTEVLLQRKKRFADVEYGFEFEIMHVEEARRRWPNAGDKIKAGGAENEAYVYDYELMESRILDNEILVWRLFAKRTKFLPGGRDIYFTDNGILESADARHTHLNLPCVRLTDVDHPGELHGLSFIDKVKAGTGAYNNLTNMILRNQIFVGHPKWMMPAGACTLDQLGNLATVVQFKGPTAPVLVQANPTPREVFEFRKELKQEFKEHSGAYGVSSGEPPKNITAGVALQFLDEKESERFNKPTLKLSAFDLQVAIMTLAVAGDEYEENSTRTIKVMGKGNNVMAYVFRTEHLQNDYDVRVQNASALPGTKSAQIQTLFDTEDRYPGMVPREQVLEMTGFGQADKFVDSATVALRTAEAENEALLDDGVEVKAPEAWEDHMKHWPVHARMIQDWSFKNQTPPEVQKKVFEHLKATEMLMIEKATINVAYRQEIMKLPGFPLLYQPSAVEITAMGGTPVGPGAKIEGDAAAAAGVDPALAAAAGGAPGAGGGPIELTPELPVAPATPSLQSQQAAEASAPIQT